MRDDDGAWLDGDWQWHRDGSAVTLLWRGFWGTVGFGRSLRGSVRVFWWGLRGSVRVFRFVLRCTISVLGLRGTIRVQSWSSIPILSLFGNVAFNS